MTHHTPHTGWKDTQPLTQEAIDAWQAGWKLIEYLTGCFALVLAACMLFGMGWMAFEMMGGF